MTAPVMATARPFFTGLLGRAVRAGAGGVGASGSSPIFSGIGTWVFGRGFWATAVAPLDPTATGLLSTAGTAATGPAEGGSAAGEESRESCGPSAATAAVSTAAGSTQIVRAWPGLPFRRPPSRRYPSAGSLRRRRGRVTVFPKTDRASDPRGRKPAPQSCFLPGKYPLEAGRTKLSNLLGCRGSCPDGELHGVESRRTVGTSNTSARLELVVSDGQFDLMTVPGRRVRKGKWPSSLC